MAGKVWIGGEQRQRAEPWGEARSRINHVSSFASCGNCPLPAFPPVLRSRAGCLCLNQVKKLRLGLVCGIREEGAEKGGGLVRPQLPRRVGRKAGLGSSRVRAERGRLK